MVYNPAVMVCGGQINCFNSNGAITSTTSHKSLLLEEFKKNPSHWFLNHPTVCYRKSAVLEVGNYNSNLIRMTEDFELGLRLLKKYGYIHNMSEVLLNDANNDDTWMPSYIKEKMVIFADFLGDSQNKYKKNIKEINNSTPYKVIVKLIDPLSRSTVVDTMLGDIVTVHNDSIIIRADLSAVSSKRFN